MKQEKMINRILCLMADEYMAGIVKGAQIQYANPSEQCNDLQDSWVTKKVALYRADQLSSTIKQYIGSVYPTSLDRLLLDNLEEIQ